MVLKEKNLKLHKIKKNRIRYSFILVLYFFMIFQCNYILYQKLYAVSSKHIDYRISILKTDTLLIAMIGDSWAENHNLYGLDTIFENICTRLIDKPIKCIARGHGGRMTREIYDNMFLEYNESNAQQNIHFTRPLLEMGPDYCVIMSGINDIWRQRSTLYYIENYVNIIRFLLRHNIVPVVLEIPNVNIKRILDGCSYKQRIYLRIYSLYSRTEWDNIDIYKAAMRKMLDISGLMDSVIYIKAEEWDKNHFSAQYDFYQQDELHLTNYGYRSLDSCIAERLVKHMRLNGK